METPPDTGLHLSDASKQVVQRALVICENRLELLMVEMQEERDRILRVFWLSLAAAIFGLLAGIAITAVIVVALWQLHPVVALLILAALFAAAAVSCYGRMQQLQRDWRTLAGTIDQLKKDRECLGKNLN